MLIFMNLETREGSLNCHEVIAPSFLDLNLWVFLDKIICSANAQTSIMTK